MSKTKLFIDVDGTIIDSIKAFCDTYNELFKNHPNFKKAQWWEVETWNFSDQCPLVHNVEDIFANELFFKYAEFINGNTKETIEKLCYKYEVVICSIGTLQNIAYKSLWLKENLPCVKEYVFLVNDGCNMDKSIIDMNNSIFIDDVKSNLDSSNAKLKICFGDEYEWNKEWQGIRCCNWTDIYKLLI